MVRAFVAMRVPIDVEADLAERLDALRTARNDLRWTRPSSWHITLQFLGECGPREIDRQIDRWSRRASRVRPMALQLAGMGTFPRAASMARVLWTGLDGDVDEWQRAAMPEQEPHLTLARVKPARDLTAVVGELSDYRSPGFDISTIELMESHLRRSGERGPRYTTLTTFPLGTGPDKH